MPSRPKTYTELNTILDKMAKKYGGDAKITLWEDGSGKICRRILGSEDNATLVDFDNLKELMESLDTQWTTRTKPVKLACLHDTIGRTWDTMSIDIPADIPDDQIAQVAIDLANKQYGTAKWVIYPESL
jgi:hypothetical protein